MQPDNPAVVVPRPPARPFRRRSPQREGQRFGHPAPLECSSVSAPSEPTVKKPKWPLIWACASCGATRAKRPDSRLRQGRTIYFNTLEPTVVVPLVDKGVRLDTMFGAGAYYFLGGFDSFKGFFVEPYAPTFTCHSRTVTHSSSVLSAVFPAGFDPRAFAGTEITTIESPLMSFELSRSRPI